MSELAAKLFCREIIQPIQFVDSAALVSRDVGGGEELGELYSKDYKPVKRMFNWGFLGATAIALSPKVTLPSISLFWGNIRDCLQFSQGYFRVKLHVIHKCMQQKLSCCFSVAEKQKTKPYSWRVSLGTVKI